MKETYKFSKRNKDTFIFAGGDQLPVRGGKGNNVELPVCGEMDKMCRLNLWPPVKLTGWPRRAKRQYDIVVTVMG